MAGFPSIELSLSCRQVHSIVHFHESGPSLRDCYSFVQTAGGSCRSKQVAVCIFKCLNISHSAAPLQPGPLRADLSAEEVMLLCVWL